MGGLGGSGGLGVVEVWGSGGRGVVEVWGGSGGLGVMEDCHWVSKHLLYPLTKVFLDF